MKLLIIEDDCIRRHTYTRIAQTTGLFRQIFAAASLDGLRESAFRPDVILLNLDTPGINGYAFLDTFRQTECNPEEKTAFVVVASVVSPRDLRRARELEIDYLLSKPLHAVKLQTILFDLFLKVRRRKKYPSAA